MYSVFVLDTFIPLFVEASLHRSSSKSSTPFALANSTTSSANIICQGAFFSHVFRHCIVMMANRKESKANPWRMPTSTANGSLVPVAHLTTVSHRWYMSFTRLMYFSGTHSSLVHKSSSSLRTLSYAFFYQTDEHTV